MIYFSQSTLVLFFYIEVVFTLDISWIPSWFMFIAETGKAE